MPKNKVSDLITDQEMTFARLVLSGTMTDRDAAKAAGLNPDTAAYTKAKPCVREYMLEHRAAVQRTLAEREAEEQRRRNIGREQVLCRLWELANISPEITRGSITGQVKALSMIVAIEGLIPDRRARSAQSYPATRPAEQQGKTGDPQSHPAAAPQEDQPGAARPQPAPASAAANRVRPSETLPWESYANAFPSEPDYRASLSIDLSPSAAPLRF